MATLVCICDIHFHLSNVIFKKIVSFTCSAMCKMLTVVGRGDVGLNKNV